MKKNYKKTKNFQKGYLQIVFYVVNYGKKFTAQAIAIYIVKRSNKEFLRSLVKTGGLIKKKGSRSKSGKNRYY